MTDRNARPSPALRWLAAIVAAPIALLIGYTGLALLIGAMPVNAGWRQADDGVVVYLESNGIHTAINMPVRHGGVDWSRLFPAADLRDPRFADWDRIAVGWGDAAFFLDTPTWADLRPQTVVAAALGSDRTLVHAEHVPTPPVDPRVRRLVLREDEYRRLAAFVAGSVAPGGRRYPGYGRGDAFYDARGHYDAVTTCNEWAGAALRRAGVRVGRWTPLPEIVLWWFDDQSTR